MTTITTLSDVTSRPLAPDGFIYAFTQEWDTNAAHFVPGNYNKMILTYDGVVVGRGVGEVNVTILPPAKVFVYKQIT